MIDSGVRLDVHWCVLSGAGDRGTGSQVVSGGFFLSGAAASAKIDVMSFRDGFFFRSRGERQSSPWF